MNLQLGWDGLPVVVRSADARGTAHVEDAVVVAVRMLPILEVEAMRALLRDALRAAGWVEAADGAMTRSFGDVVASLGVDGSSVELRAASAREVVARGSVTAAQGDDAEAVEARARAEAEARLEAERARAMDDARRELLARLAGAEATARAELQRALNGVYREALERRARALGEVESVRETAGEGGDYEVTVVVRA